MRPFDRTPGMQDQRLNISLSVEMLPDHFGPLFFDQNTPCTTPPSPLQPQSPLPSTMPNAMDLAESTLPPLWALHSRPPQPRPSCPLASPCPQQRACALPEPKGAELTSWTMPHLAMIDMQRPADAARPGRLRPRPARAVRLRATLDPSYPLDTLV